MIILGIGWIGYNFLDDYRAGSKSKDILNTINNEKENINYNSIDSNNNTIPKIKIDNYEYIGVIKIPKIGIELPIIDSYSESKMKTSPCLYSGSIEQNNMIIAAHAYRSHFGKLKNLSIGDEIIFEDISGNIFKYSVSKKEILLSSDTEKMNEGDWNLTLFTCTLSGNKRVTIRAKRK